MPLADLDVQLDQLNLDSKVVLNGSDISKFCRVVDIHAEYGKPTTARLEIFANVNGKAKAEVDALWLPENWV